MNRRIIMKIFNFVKNLMFTDSTFVVEIDEEKPRQLSEDQIQECRDAFAFFDKHRRGKIRLKDLGTLMRNLGENPTEVELEDIIIESNLDGSGTVDFPHFINIMTRRCENSDDATRLAFGAFDMNGDGLISVDELKRYFLKVGQPCTEDEIEDLMKEVDIDGDGYMNYDEFLEMVNMS